MKPEERTLQTCVDGRVIFKFITKEEGSDKCPISKLPGTP
jgi:hypothetical protein